MAPLTVSPLTRFHIHLPIASAASPLPPSLSLSLTLFSPLLFCSKPNGVLTEGPNADTASPHTPTNMISLAQALLDRVTNEAAFDSPDNQVLSGHS